MKYYPVALFSTLLEDLSGLLPRSVVDDFVNGKSVEFWPDISYRQVCAVQLMRSILKKCADGTDTDSADEAAWLKFRASNDRCRDWTLSPIDSIDVHLLGELRQELINFYERRGPDGYRVPLICHPGDILDRGTLGPGANVGAVGNDFYSKMWASDLSVTGECLYSHYARWVVHRDQFYAAEYSRLANGHGVRLVEGSNLSFVPKTTEVSRTICVEPTLNMYYQRGIGEIVTERIRERYGIDFSSQPEVNKRLAADGSATGKIVTIDLESASDSISLSMVRHVLPAQALRWMELCRSPETRSAKFGSLQLHMLSSMGNGYTFPVQTSLFCAVVVAAAKVHGYPLNRRAGVHSCWGVFGDDIIVPREILGGVKRLLTLLGFIVNSKKSFFEGLFRESCGGDYWNGSPCRGVYAKTLLTAQSRIVLINRLNLFTAETGLNLSRTIQFLARTVPRVVVPLWENDDAGIRVPHTYLALTGQALRRRQGSFLYKRFATRPQTIRVLDGEIRVPKGTRSRTYNAAGLLRAFLRGDIVDGVINVRHNVTVYKVRLGIAPNWDVPHDRDQEYRDGLRRLESACLENLPW